MYLIKGGFIFNAIYATVKSFIHERTRAKFIFSSGEDYKDKLLEKIDAS
jgi:CRAL/TRIO domain